MTFTIFMIIIKNPGVKRKKRNKNVPREKNRNI
jgi:hypothetical protein